MPLVHRRVRLQMRLWILRAIGVALDRNMRHRALEVVLADALDAAVRARKLGEIARRRSGDADPVVRRAARADGQPAIPGVLAILGAHRPRDAAERKNVRAGTGVSGRVSTGCGRSMTKKRQ